MYSIDDFNNFFKIYANNMLENFRKKLININDNYGHKGTYGSSMHLKELSDAFSLYADDLINNLISEIQKNLAPEVSSNFFNGLTNNKVYLDELREIVSDKIRSIEKPYGKSVDQSYVSIVDKVYSNKEYELILRLEHMKF